MTINQWLNLLSAASVLLYGIGAMLVPGMIAKLVHHELPDGRGKAEFRIAQAGIFIGLGLMAVLLRNTTVYQLMAGLWFGAAITRLIAIALDRPKLTSDYLGFAVMEFAFGILALI